MFTFIFVTLGFFGLIYLAAHILLPIIMPILGSFGLVEVCGLLTYLFNGDIHSLVIVYIFSVLLTIVGYALQ